MQDTMIAVTAIIMIASLRSCNSAIGVGKAWQISSIYPEHTTHPTWSPLNLSAFQVRSVSGIGRLTSRKNWPTVKNSENSPDYEKNDSTPKTENRITDEAKDMAASSTDDVLYDHPIFKGIIESSQHNDVEILPGIWEKSVTKHRKEKNLGTCSQTLEKETKGLQTYSRVIREVDEDNQMDKISGMKNVREARLSSPESWSKHPFSVDVRHRVRSTNDEEETPRPPIQSYEAPRTEFITANRRNYDVRESRDFKDFPISRTFEDITMRTPLHDREYDAAYPRGYYYPDHFRTEREYYVRGLNDPVAYTSDRYRIDDYDLYRNRPTPKPKRIIYYATLPEIVRKPVDLRNYQRPYDSMSRPSIPHIMTRDGFPKIIPNLMDRDVENRYRHRSYSYNAYDPYIKKPDYFDRSYKYLLDRSEDNRYLDQDLDHTSYKEARATDESTNLTSEQAGSRHTEKLPWPVKIDAEINIKDNQKISGRKVFGQYQDYERLRPSTRIERKDNVENVEITENRN